MRSAWRFNFFSFMLLCLTAQAQQKTNPHTGINWPANCNTAGMVYNFTTNTCIATPDISGLTPGPPAICANGSGGALTQTGCTIPPTQVTWPGSCSSGVYSPVTNTCVPPGTAANPAGSQGQLQLNGAGIFGATQLYYSSQFPTGLVGAMAAGRTVFTDPADIITSTTYSFTNMIPGVPNAFQWKNMRGGPLEEFYHNSGWTNGFNGFPSAHAENCLIDQPNTTNNNGTHACHMIMAKETQPGVGLGTSNVQAVGNKLWVVPNFFYIVGYYNGAGTAENISSSLYHFGIGDTALYSYVRSMGGNRDGSGEGVGNYFSSIENTAWYVGTCTGNCSTGSTSISTNATANAGSQGVGRYAFDLTAGPLGGLNSNSIVGLAAGLVSTTEAVTLANPVPVSNAWGLLTTALQPQSADIGGPPYGTNLTVSVSVTSGTFDATDPICFASQFHEQIKPASAISGSGTISFTAKIRKPHESGTLVMQGGACGYGMEQVINTVGNNRYLVDVIGSTSANVIQTTFFQLAQGSALGQGGGALNNNLYGSSTIATLSSNGPGANNVYASGVAFGGAWTNLLNSTSKTNIIIAGASDAAFNNVCTAFTWITQNSGTCTMAGISAGSHIATGATYKYATTTGPINFVNLWPIAEVIDVQNYTLNPPSMDGTLVLEPNIIAFSNGHVIHQPNDEAGLYRTIKGTAAVGNPYATHNNLYLSSAGLGAQGGCNSTTCNATIAGGNGQPDTTYFDNGGNVQPLNGWSYSGAFYDFLVTNHTPANGASMFYLGTATPQKTNPNYNFCFSTIVNNASTPNTDCSTPFLGDRAISANGQLQLGGTTNGVNFTSNIDQNMRMNGSILFQQTYVAPTLSTVVIGPGSGTLTNAPNTYCYQIQGRTSAPVTYTPLSNEVCGPGTTTGNNTLRLTWVRPPGMNSAIIVYGRGTGAGKTILVTLTAPITTWVDDGSGTPTGSNTAATNPYPIIDQAAQIGLNSTGGTGGTAELILRAPASMTANITATAPYLNTVAASANVGFATLVSGTVTVTTTTACTAANTCVYSLTNCGVGGTQGMLSVGTVTAGTSFVINSSAGAADTSKVCWRIN